MTEVPLFNLVCNQVENFFLKLTENEKQILSNAAEIAKEKTLIRFSKILNRHYHNFNPYHSDQYTSFLYTLSYELSTRFKEKTLADKIFYLNRIMNSVNIYHEVKLPDTFILEHPLGTVLGRADYGDDFIVYQQCTVGSSRDQNGEMKYPKIGKNVVMYTNSSIIGDSNVGNNCIIAANTQIQNQDVPDDSLVFGTSPNLIIKENKKNFKFFKES